MSELRGPPMANPAIGPQQQPMQMNPAYLQWMQLKQAHDAQVRQRQQQFMAACELIAEDAAQSYKIDIEADSTIAADEQEEKTSRIEFLQAITPFLETVLPQMQGNPAMAPLGKELVLFAVRGFRVSRGLEDAFETALDKLMQSPPQPPPGKQGNTKSPMEIQADLQEAQGKIQVDQQANMVKMAQANTQAQIERERLQAQQDKDSVELALRGREMQGREALENARIQHEQSLDARGLV